MSEGRIAEYRDYLWEGHPPTLDGQPVDVVALPPPHDSETGERIGVGHAVLGVGGADSGRVVYDPWPESDGSARMSPDASDADTRYRYDDSAAEHIDFRHAPGPLAGHRASTDADD